MIGSCRPKYVATRMHSSRILTARLLTVSRRARRGVFTQCEPVSSNSTAACSDINCAIIVFFSFLKDMSPFCGPLIPLFWTSADVWGSLIRTWWRRTCYMFPGLHLWCDTCQPLFGQHGSRASLRHTYGGIRNWEVSCCHSQCEIRQTRRSTDSTIPAQLIVQ